MSFAYVKRELAKRWLSMMLSCIAVMLGARAATAHEIRPAIVTITAVAADRIEATVALNIEGLIAGIGPEHKDTNDAPEAAAYNTLRQLPPGALRQRFDAASTRWLDAIDLQLDGRRVALAVADATIPDVGDPSLARISTVRVTGPASAGASTVKWTYGKQFGSAILRVRLAGQEAIEGGWLKDGQRSAPYVRRQGFRPAQHGRRPARLHGARVHAHRAEGYWTTSCSCSDCSCSAHAGSRC